MLFVYPAWIFLLLAPSALLPLKWAVAFWTGSLLLGTVHLIGYLAVRWGGHRLGRVGLWAAVLAVGCTPYVSIAVAKGQLSLVGLGALFLAIRLLDGTATRGARGIPESNPGGTRLARGSFHELMAGTCLAFAIMKPTLTIVPTAGILLWATVERKGYFIAGFACFIGVLSAASWFAVGNWLPDYVQLLVNTGGAPVLWSLALLPWPWNAFFAFLFVGIGAFAFTRFLQTRNRAQWFSATVLAALALLPMRWIYDLLLGLLVPVEAEQMSRPLAASVVLALLAPWGLALFPEPLRWPAQVVGLPLAWALVWFCQFVLPIGSKGMR
jgi:hypothetical protein